MCPVSARPSLVVFRILTAPLIHPVSVTIPEKTFAVIVLAQQDVRYFAAISGYASWSLDFAVFKKGETEPLATAAHNRYWGRNVQVELELEAGDYVVHVSLHYLGLMQLAHFFDRYGWIEASFGRRYYLFSVFPTVC